jgi:hypothetical protein
VGHIVLLRMGRWLRAFKHATLHMAHASLRKILPVASASKQACSNQSAGC